MKELYDLGAAGEPSLPAGLLGAAELSRLWEVDGGVRGLELPDSDLARHECCTAIPKERD